MRDRGTPPCSTKLHIGTVAGAKYTGEVYESKLSPLNFSLPLSGLEKHTKYQSTKFSLPHTHIIRASDSRRFSVVSVYVCVRACVCVCECVYSRVRFCLRVRCKSPVDVRDTHFFAMVPHSWTVHLLDLCMSSKDAKVRRKYRLQDIDTVIVDHADVPLVVETHTFPICPCHSDKGMAPPPTRP